ncbi:hypothetical protein Droror1_Dr00005826 [Drosera rotundifolia]
MDEAGYCEGILNSSSLTAGNIFLSSSHCSYVPQLRANILQRSSCSTEMGSEANEKDMVVTQVSFGGLDGSVTGKNIEDVQKSEAYNKVEPHAFVHFATPDAVQWVLDAAGCSDLVLAGKVLKVTLGLENPSRVNQRRRKDYKPFVVERLQTHYNAFVLWVLE